MIDFLIKSTISLTVFLGFYHLILEKEKMHQFNRFYLLFAIIISFSIPFITFEMVKVIPVVQYAKPVIVDSIPISNQETGLIPVKETIDYTPVLLLSLYGLITFILLIRFAKNIFRLMSKINSNQVVKYNNTKLVLTAEKILPYTFLNTIFLNEEDYRNQNIEEELFTHELVHVTQKHTLDVLFVEFLKTLFWFNPLFVFYKKAIQLNHEFLADERVVAYYDNVPFYQSLLLQKGNGNQTITLASNWNYLVTKKRLIMMTKNTSKSISIIKKIAVAPVLGGLILFFCVEITAQKKAAAMVSPNNNKILVSHPKQELTKDQYFAGVRIIVYEGACMTKTHEMKGGEIKMNKLYEDLTEPEKDKYKLVLMLPKSSGKKSPTKKEMEEFKNSKKYAVWINDKTVLNKILENYKLEDIVYFRGSAISKNARTKKHPQPFQYRFYTNNYFERHKMGEVSRKYTGDTIKIFKSLKK